jgi:hypothetical protein
MNERLTPEERELLAARYNELADSIVAIKRATESDQHPLSHEFAELARELKIIESRLS